MRATASESDHMLYSRFLARGGGPWTSGGLALRCVGRCFALKTHSHSPPATATIMTLILKLVDREGGEMRVKKMTTVTLQLTEFDDGSSWAWVGVGESGRHFRTVYQTPSAPQISEDELDHALVVLDEIANTWVNRWRQHQRVLF